MSGEKDKKDIPEEPDDKKTYNFMHQTIRKKPVDRRQYYKKIIFSVCCAVGAGILAAFVFVAMIPTAEKALGVDTASAKVEIPEDQDQNAVASASQESTSSGSSGPVASSSVEISSAAGSSDSGQTESQGSSLSGMSLEDYKNLYQEMLDVAQKPERSLVLVTSIVNESDYFNQMYENENQNSGIAVAETSDSLYILTNHGNLSAEAKIKVTFYDGTMAEGKFRRADANTELAVVVVPLSSLSESTKSGLDTASLGNSYTASKGEPVLAIGSPLGYNDSVAFGVVTSTTNEVSRYDRNYNLITTDIEGSSKGSGVLVDLDGQIIGVISQGIAGDGDNTVTGLAISQIKNLIESLSNNDSQNYIGIRGQDVTAEISKNTGIPVGIMITEVAQDSPAMLAGLKESDVIIKLGEKDITTMRQYTDELNTYTPGDTPTITAMRKGASGYEKVQFSCTVGEK